MVTNPRGSGVSEYDELLKQELAGEDTRKASLEQRGLAVITTSGVLVTLLFGLAALTTKREATFWLSAFAESALAIALVLFVGAAICALITNAPFSYDQVKTADIEGRLNEEPLLGNEDAVRDIALTRAKELRSAREKNGTKALILLVAMGLEVAAVLAVAVAIWDILSPF